MGNIFNLASCESWREESENCKEKEALNGYLEEKWEKKPARRLMLAKANGEGIQW